MEVRSDDTDGERPSKRVKRSLDPADEFTDFRRYTTYANQKEYFERFFQTTCYHGTPLVVERRSVRSRSVHSTLVVWRHKLGSHGEAFLRRWVEDADAATIPDLDAVRVQQSVRVPPFQSLVPSIPSESVEANAIALGYDLTLLRELFWRAAADFVFPNFPLRGKVYKAIMALTQATDLQSICDDVICSGVPRSQLDVDLQAVLQTSSFAKEIEPPSPGGEPNRGGGEVEGRVSVTELFYGGLCHHSLRGDCYNPAHAKSRPKPNKMSLTAQEYLNPLLDRYVELLERVERFVQQFVPVSLYGAKRTEWKNHATKVLKGQRKAIEVLRRETEPARLVREYQRKATHNTHTDATLLALPIEQIRTMVEMLPANQDMAAIVADTEDSFA